MRVCSRNPPSKSERGKNACRNKRKGSSSTTSTSFISLMLRKRAILRKWSVGQHRADIGFRDHLPVDLGVAVEPPHRLAPADQPQMVLDGVTGDHGLAKFALVDSEEIHRAGFFGVGIRADADHACGLRHGLDHHDARIDRTIGKVPEKAGLVEGDVLDADTAVIGPDVDHPVDQQHRITMRQRLQDVLDVDDIEQDLGFLHHSFPSPSPLRWAELSRARRSSVLTSRNHCLAGRAMWPPQRWFAGISSITPLVAAICAPSPIVMWLLSPALAPIDTLSPIVRLPASPIWAASRQCLPMVTLWPIWT